MAARQGPALLGTGLSPGQFATLVTAGYITQGLFYFPRDLVMEAGRAALWAFLLTAALGGASLLLFLTVMEKAEGETLTGLGFRLLGPAFWPLAALIVLYHLFLLLGFGVMTVGLVIHSIFLASTPLWAVAAALLGGSLYMAWFGPVPLARAAQSLYLPVALITVLVAVMGVSLIRHPLLLVPALPASAAGFARAVYHNFGLFLGIDALGWFYPYVHAADRARARRTVLWALVAASVVFAWGLEDVLATFGPDFVPALRWPAAQFLRLLNLVTFYVNKFGLVVIVMWTVAAITFGAVHLSVVGHTLYPFLRFRDLRGHRWILAVAALLAWGMVWVFKSPYRVIHVFLPVAIGAGWVYSWALPLLLLGAAALHGRRGAPPQAG
ncbi:MAG: GerAB/ArcD/ProY family transporter [Firmicutes bacterium]|nr:GerAB/ArcD/ProY family transporter [Bacillota bacterium]